MAKIFYGVSGEGMGHAIRSKPIISHLEKTHSVRVFASQRAYRFLKKHFTCSRLLGYRLIYRENKVAMLLTFLDALVRTPFLWLYNFKVGLFILRENPDVIISDFEPALTWWGFLFRVPVISIDNQHSLISTHVEYPSRHKLAYTSMFFAAKYLIPYADHYLSSSLIEYKSKTEKLHLVKPLLREEIQRLKPSLGKHVLVYQTSLSNSLLIDVLEQLPHDFIVYGLGKREKKGNITFKKSNEKEFFTDLASCKAVITNGGFTLISEALYLGKPIFSHVIQNQFEQIINGYQLQKLGYGMYSEDFLVKDLELFFSELDMFRKNLKKYKKYDNKDAFKILDKIISSCAK